MQHVLYMYVHVCKQHVSCGTWSLGYRLWLSESNSFPPFSYFFWFNESQITCTVLYMYVKVGMKPLRSGRQILETNSNNQRLYSLSTCTSITPKICPRDAMASSLLYLHVMYVCMCSMYMFVCTYYIHVCMYVVCMYVHVHTFLPLSNRTMLWDMYWAPSDFDGDFLRTCTTCPLHLEQS